MQCIVARTCVPDTVEGSLTLSLKHVRSGGIQVGVANGGAAAGGYGCAIERGLLPGDPHPPLLQDRLVDDAQHRLPAVQQRYQCAKQRLACGGWRCDVEEWVGWPLGGLGS
jgi:hypothetical protein